MRKLVLAVLLASLGARAEVAFQPREGDRIVLLGDTLIEREQESGWLETVMHGSFPQAHFIVRNLGWSADTPAGGSRASFDFANPQKGFSVLTNEVGKVHPTVVILGYGMACSFDGQAGLAKFKGDLNRLIDAIGQGASQPVRFVVLSPLQHYRMPSPLPDPTSHNGELWAYTKALRDLARERGFPFVDLFDWTPAGKVTELSDDGIHLTDKGYHAMALEVGRQLGWKERKGDMEGLRRVIIRKNQLFFDRWRPENETYLLGFRNYEQGKNAREIPEFDPFIDAADREISSWPEKQGQGARPTAAPTVAKVATPLALPDFEVAPGFEVSLWASDPMIAKPTQMNFDPQGRLWVATSSIYPQIAPGQKADDKIIVLEDSHNLGHADKSTVFAGGLFIPTGVAPGDGGCYVGQGTELLHFSATGERRVVLSGFGTEDTHHMVHTLTWAPDGRLNFDQSIYIHTHIETPHGVVHLNSGGVFQLRPPTMQLEVILRGFCNPWGHQFDKFGQEFVTDGAGFQGISWGIPDATYFTYAEMRRELPSISPGQYPKFCGLEIVESGQFPADWQGNFITEDFRAHRIARFGVSEEGAGYVTKEMPDLLRTTNETFRPVDLKFGPDGALYIADWCNPIINHGEVDFRDPRRDHEHGRIWRVTAKGRPLLPRHDWTATSTEGLLEALLSTNSFDVQQCRRALTERGRAILPTLARWAERQTDGNALLQALWMYQCIDVRNDALLDRVLAAGDGHIRAAGARVLRGWPRVSQEAVADVYARLLQDPFPRVRVEALRAIARAPSLGAAEAALNTWKADMDPFENYALWLTINDLAAPWLAAVESGEWKIAGHEGQFAFAMEALKPAAVEPVLRVLLKQGALTADGKGPWIGLIASAGEGEEVQELYDRILDGGFDKSAAARAWAAVDDAAARGVFPATGKERVCAYFSDGDRETQLKAIELAGRWQLRGDCLTKLFSLASQTETPEAVRSAIFDALRHIGGTETVEPLVPLTAKGERVEVRKPAILTLAALDGGRAAGPALAWLADLQDADHGVAAWRALLGTSGIGPTLAAAIPHSGFPEAAAKAGLKAIREMGGTEPELVLALSRVTGSQGGESQLTKTEMSRLVEAVAQQGDAARGERIFRRPQQNCMSCHAIGGVGGHVGPDLTSIGASAQVDYLIDSVLYPNKDIKEGFQAFMVNTKDGETTVGIPVRENDRELVMHTSGDQVVSIPHDQILSRKPSGSLMPSGLTDNLNHQEQLDLFRFLSALGKPGPFDASHSDVARFWMVSGAGMKAGHKVYSLVDGRLLREDLQSAAQATSGAIVATARFRATAGSAVHFQVTGLENPEMAIDGKPSAATVQLSSGEHSLELRLEADKLPDYIRVQSDGVTFLGQ